MGNERAVDYMIQYSIIKCKADVDTEMSIVDEESTPISLNN